MKPAAGTTVAQKYVLERELARGGMGAVWRALHQELDDHVAIKFMDPELALSVEARDRFKREARAAAKLRSSHVVQIFDVGVDEGTPYIVMELLKGVDLRKRLRSVGRMSMSEAAGILNQACKALRLAADAGIVHRDLKPGNIFLAQSGDDEVVKILDFGVAKATRNRSIGVNTSSGTLLGSPYYMSPEQARGGKDLDHRADLFSMAVILFIMITGKKPFPSGDVGDVIVKICTEPALRIHDIVSDLPLELDAFFDCALAKDPDDRFQTAAELATAFAVLAAEHEGAPIPQASFSGRYDAISDSLSVEDSVRSHAGLDDAAERAPGTLTAATRSVTLTMPDNHSRAYKLGAAVLALVAVVALVWMLIPGAEEPSAAAQPPAGGTATSAAASTEPSGDTTASETAADDAVAGDGAASDGAPSATLSASQSAAANAAPGSAKAPAQPNVRPRPAAPPGGRPAARPKGKPTDPVLGF